MANPEQYEKQASFADDSANNKPGRSLIDPKALDREFVNLGLVTNQLSVGMKNILRDDGFLRDACVDVHSLSRSVLNLIGGYNLRGVWLADRYYAVGDVVDFNGSVWACHQAHNAGAVFDETKYSRFGFAGGDDAALAAVQAGNYARQASNAKNAAEAASETAIENANTLSAKLQDIAANFEQSSQNARSAKTSADVAEAASMRAQNAAVRAEEIANPGIPYTGATKHINLNGKNLNNVGELKLGDGRNSDYQQVILGNYGRSPGKGNYGAIFNGKHGGDHTRWMAIGTFGEDGNHISGLWADAAKAYVRIGSTNHELATKGTTLTHYGITDAARKVDMRGHITGTSTPWQLALPNQIPVGIYEGLTSNANLQGGGAGVMRIVKAWGDGTGDYAIYREGIQSNGETYRQYSNSNMTAWRERIRIDSRALAGQIEEAAPPGTVMYFAGRNPPAGWLKANGAAVSRTTYAPLFAAIGTTYGSGDGRTTFNLPDLRGEFLRGWDDGRGVDAGRTIGSVQTDEIKRHVHKFISFDVTGSDALAVVRSDLFEQDDDVPDGLQHSNIIEDSRYWEDWEDNEDNGWAQPKLTSPYATGGTETRPRNVALLAIIKI